MRSKLLWLGAVALAGAAVVAAVALTPGSKPSLTSAPSGSPPTIVPRGETGPAPRRLGRVTVGRAYRHNVSPRFRRIPAVEPERGEAEAAERNPRPVSIHRNEPEAARQSRRFSSTAPSPDLTFDGIGYPGVDCYCVPPDTNGDVGATQYVQSVNQAIQVFSKSTGASVMGPVAIETLWSGFGGVCENDAEGDPVVAYDQLAGRWVVSQFGGQGTYGSITDECIAVSTTSDATGSYYRYGFHLGASFFDYPKLGVWPDGYYMSMNVFNAAGTAYLGPQPFVFDRTKMLTGASATYVTTGITGGSSEETYLPADLDGSTQPSSGAPNPFVEWPGGGKYKVYRFHVDWASPGSSTFTLAGSPSAAGFTQLSQDVPQAGTTSRLDNLGDRLMFRAAYRKFGDHESLVGNYTVSSGGVAGVRWLELRNVTSGTPAVYQESTYQPDSTWRWMGSAAMDKAGDLAVGYNASSSSINPQIRYAGRLAGDPLNTLAQSEATLHAGAGSQVGSFSRWGDYSTMSVDPVDDCTFWFATEYYPSTGSSGWRTRIARFSFPSCSGSSTPTTEALSVATAGTGSGTVTSSPSGLSCSSSCSAAFTQGSAVTLTASPQSGSNFSGWSGDCSGTGTCTVSMTAARSVTATFSVAAQTLSVSRGGNGQGTVTSSPAGISCGSDCSEAYGYGTGVTLSATAAEGSIFTGWSGRCFGTGDCTVTMDAARSVTATFETDRAMSVSIGGDGSGTVLSNPEGISCASPCSHSFTYGTLLTLSPVPAVRSRFTGWRGDCSGAGNAECVLTMDGDHSTTAVFRRLCVVPNLRGRTLAAARRALAAAKCTTGAVRRSFSAGKKGTVVSQSPPPGRVRDPGAFVSFVVS